MMKCVEVSHNFDPSPFWNAAELLPRPNHRLAARSPSLSRCFPVIASLRMAYLTMEAEIDHGRIIPKEPEKLPATGKALLTVLESPERKPDMEVIKSILGTLKTDIDAAEWQRQQRAEWDERERKQWSNR
jgi:hypothetical protein